MYCFAVGYNTSHMKLNPLKQITLSIYVIRSIVECYYPLPLPPIIKCYLAYGSKNRNVSFCCCFLDFGIGVSDGKRLK